MKSAFERRTYTAPDGFEIVYSTVGTGEPALVFVHGGLAKRSFWDGDLRTFAPRRRRFRSGCGVKCGGQANPQAPGHTVAGRVGGPALILNPGVILRGGEVGSHPRLLQEVKTLLQCSEFAVVRVELGALGPSTVFWDPSMPRSMPPSLA